MNPKSLQCLQYIYPERQGAMNYRFDNTLSITTFTHRREQYATHEVMKQQDHQVKTQPIWCNTHADKSESNVLCLRSCHICNWHSKLSGSCATSLSRLCSWFGLMFTQVFLRQSRATIVLVDAAINTCSFETRREEPTSIMKIQPALNKTISTSTPTTIALETELLSWNTHNEIWQVWWVTNPCVVKFQCAGFFPQHAYQHGKGHWLQ